jgi:hypothetical protein
VNPKCKIHALVISVALAGFLLPSALLGQQTGMQRVFPDGWFVYPESKLRNLSENTKRCFNYSHLEWKISRDGEGVKVTSLVRQKFEPSALPLPPSLKHQDGMPGRTVRAGLSAAMHFDNSWLIAYDGGEWGGGLWLTNEDGSKTRRIVEDNVHFVIPIEGGLLVLSGLAHMSMDFGNAFIFSNPDGLNISLRHTVHLDGEPTAYTKQAGGAVLFTTTKGLCKIMQSGELTDLTYFPEWTSAQYANSMVVANDGSILIAMRMFVLKLRQDSSGGYSEEWFIPAECKNFYLKEYDCVCKP